MSELKTALDATVKRETKNEVIKKRKERAKNQKEKEVNNVAKKTRVDEVVVRKRVVPTDLDDVVALKKQKLVSNELDEFIFNQEERKKVRDGSVPKVDVVKKGEPNDVLKNLLTSKPEFLESADNDTVMKLAMLMAGSRGGDGGGGMNPLMMMMMMNQNQGDEKGGGILEMVQALKVLNELNKDNEPKQNSGGNDMTKMLETLMMFQVMQGKNQPQKQIGNGRDQLTGELISLISKQSNMEREMLMKKLEDLEYRTSQVDPLSDAKRLVDFMSSFKGLMGVSQSGEQLTHDREMKKMDYEMERERRKEDSSTDRMDQVGDLITNTVKTFGDILAKPVAEGIKDRLENPPEEEKKNRDYSPTPQPEIDLDEIDLEEYENLQKYPSLKQEKKKSRFNVTTSDGEE